MALTSATEVLAAKGSIITAAFIVTLLYGVYRLSRVGSRDKRLPPGPPTVPILGNLLSVPTSGLATKLGEWGKQYGGVYSLKFGPQTVIVLYDRKAVHHLLDKKGTIYSERPRDYVANLVAGGDSFAFMDSTPLWRSERKVAAHNLSPRKLDEEVAVIQNAEVTVLLSDLVRDPARYYQYIQRTTASVASAIVWGHRGATPESFWGHAVYEAMDNYSASLEAGANPPVDQFPFLQYIPDRYAPWKRRAKGAYKCMDETWSEARRRVDARRKAGIKRSAIIDSILDGEKHGDLVLNDHQMNHFLGVLVEGGSDTTASSTLTSLLHLALHPEFQRKAQKEIDAVIGAERMPQWSDFSKLPYINCLIKEALRIHPVLPMSIPHRVNKDDWYEGMLIPKDATVIMPTWAMHLDDDLGFKDAGRYNPDRYLDFPLLADSYAGSPNYQGRDHYSYGAGRRICPGIHLAERTQWRMTANILWAFDIERRIDEKTGKLLPIDPKSYHEGISHCPKEFPVVFKPRSQAHIDTISQQLRKAQGFLAAWDD